MCPSPKTWDAAARDESPGARPRISPARQSSRASDTAWAMTARLGPRCKRRNRNRMFDSYLRNSRFDTVILASMQNEPARKANDAASAHGGT